MARKQHLDRGPDLLAKALADREWSMGDAEREMGFADGIVSKWIARRRTPGLASALKMETVLGIPARSWVATESPSNTTTRKAS